MNAPASTFFDPEEIASLRARAQELARMDRQPKDGRWHPMPLDPARIVGAFDRLRIAPGWALRGYAVSDGHGGRGVVWAVPAKDPAVAPESCLRDGLPRPPGAAGFLEALRGDGTPASYLQLSLLTRQLMELGAFWHSLVWTGQHLVMVEPADWRRRTVYTWFDRDNREQEEVRWEWISIPRGGPGPDPSAPPLGWQFHGEWPREWRPEVRVTADAVQVRFYVYDRQGFERLIRFVDTYHPPSLVPETREELIATGGRGIVY